MSAPLVALLERVAERLGVAAIDELWIFPARRFAGGETAVIVVSVFHHDAPRRRVFTAHYTARGMDDGGAVLERLDEQAVAPADRIGAVVDGVLARLDEDVAGAPRVVRVGGENGRWAALLDELREAAEVSRRGAG